MAEKRKTKKTKATKKAAAKATKKAESKVPVAKKEPQYYQAVGRRKEATARVRLYTVGEGGVQIGEKSIKKGEIMVNFLPADKYFPGAVNQKVMMEPFRTTNTVGRFAVSAKVSGGGLSGQLDAFIHGISRALVEVDLNKFRPILKKRGFLTRDARVKERRKAGYAQSARAKKQSPKR